MQKGICSQTRAANVAGIPVNFGFNQDDMALDRVVIGMRVVFNQLLCLVPNFPIPTYRFKVQE